MIAPEDPEQDASATGSDGEASGPPPADEGKASLENRIKGLEHRLKGMTLLVAVVALVAPAVSAYSATVSADAARSSADTAKQSLDTARQAKDISDQMRKIAQAQYESAGALVEVSPVIEVRGTCNPRAPQSDQGPFENRPAKATVHIRNAGRSGINLSWAQVNVRTDMPGNAVWEVPIASHPSGFELEGLHGFDATMPLDCSELARNNLQDDPANSLIAFLKRKPGYVTIVWYGPSLGINTTTVVGVVHTG